MPLRGTRPKLAFIHKPMNKNIVLFVIAGSAMAFCAVPESKAQTTPGPQPGICTRACWGARAPSGGIGQSSVLNRAIIHHTADVGQFNTTSLAASQANMRTLQNYCMDNLGYSDIMYNFCVDKLGNIFEARSGSMTSLPNSAHDGVNSGSFGFTLMGYFHPPYNHVAPSAMLTAYYNLIAWRMPSGWSPYGAGAYGAYTAGVGWLAGHKNVFSTACPGDNIYPNLITDNVNSGSMRSDIAARRGGGTPAINPPYMFDANSQGWTAGSGICCGLGWSGTGWPGVIFGDQNGGDAYIISPPASFVGNSADCVSIDVYPQHGNTSSHNMQVFYKTAGANFWDANKSSSIYNYTASNSWHRLNINVGASGSPPQWANQLINQFRVDFDNVNHGNRWLVSHILVQRTPRYYFGANAEGWTAGGGICCGVGWTGTGWPGVIFGDQGGGDAYFLSPNMNNFLGAHNDVLYINVYPQAGNTANHDMKIYWRTAAENYYTEAKSTAVQNYTKQNGWIQLAFPVGTYPGWRTFITGIRVDVDNVNHGNRWLFDFIIIDHAK